MECLDIIKKAIQLRKPFHYEYHAPDHVAGIRIGHPHAVFIHPTSGNVNMDIWKIGGVSSNPSKILPGWQQYRVEFIRNVVILEDEECFESADGYNPHSKQYIKAIIKL
mgnify:CR=1 FL=1